MFFWGLKIVTSSLYRKLDKIYIRKIRLRVIHCTCNQQSQIIEKGFNVFISENIDFVINLVLKLCFFILVILFIQIDKFGFLFCS